mgnify:CR=1 FL=1
MTLQCPGAIKTYSKPVRDQDHVYVSKFGKNNKFTKINKAL